MPGRPHTALLDPAGRAGVRFDGYGFFYAWRFS
jgi:hypothetical protein